MSNNKEKSGSLIDKIIELFFGKGDSEDEAALEKSSAVIYEIMNFIFLNKSSNSHRFDRDFFCSSIKKETFSCAEAVRFGVEQGWIEESEGEIVITEYGFRYENEFWKTFR